MGASPVITVGPIGRDVRLFCSPSSVGRETIKKIVQKVIPQWKGGLCPVQEDLVAPILDGDDILCCTVTGDGKSAAFYVPILVLNEYNAHPELYPRGLPTKPAPV
ncbi:hypothetical protein C8J57DRAFT_1532470 [Mycena rebaudengoi]|nr:hypothetical protein C8J57DRAFT_1532470 [Mycena rebaudengoi]